MKHYHRLSRFERFMQKVINWLDELSIACATNPFFYVGFLSLIVAGMITLHPEWVRWAISLMGS